VIAISATGDMLASAGDATDIRLWDLGLLLEPLDSLADAVPREYGIVVDGAEGRPVYTNRLAVAR
jgi:hypothetical protein